MWDSDTVRKQSQRNRLIHTVAASPETRHNAKSTRNDKLTNALWTKKEIECIRMWLCFTTFRKTSLATHHNMLDARNAEQPWLDIAGKAAWPIKEKTLACNGCGQRLRFRRHNENSLNLKHRSESGLGFKGHHTNIQTLCNSQSCACNNVLPLQHNVIVFTQLEIDSRKSLQLVARAKKMPSSTYVTKM